MDAARNWYGAKSRALELSLLLVRAYIRHMPFTLGKRSIWDRIVERFFLSLPHQFIVSTTFGVRVSGNTRDIIQRFIYFFGVWEPCLTCWIVEQLAPGDVFIDVGANIGYYTLLASKLVGELGLVVAIEPSPTIFNTLKNNLALNKARNIRLVNMAVSDRPQVLRLFRGPEWNVGLTTTVEKSSFKLEGEVIAEPLSDILKPEEIQKARLVKIDVEGAEWAVAAGMGSILNSCRPDIEIVIEVDPRYLALQGKCPDDVLQIFLNAGFRAYSLESEYQTELYLQAQQTKTRRPRRVRNPIQDETNIVFSRKDAEVI